MCRANRYAPCMLEQATDFRDESDALFALLDPLDEHDWERKTQFKEWTINDIVAHLHFGNYAADLSLKDSAAFTAFMRGFSSARKPGTRHLDLTHAWLEGTRNRALLDHWREFYREMADRFLVADPKKRVP